MTKALVINLGFGNLYGLNQALISAGFDAEICTDSALAESADVLVLPGVGSFGNGVAKLKESGWQEQIEQWIDKQRPLLGICLGMQLLFEKSYEFGEHKGFGAFKGSVVKIQTEKGERAPKMGWYHIQSSAASEDDRISSVGLDLEERVYFVHSFGAQSEEKENIIANVNYSGNDYIAVVRKGSVWGTQFHPENSHNNGLNFLKAFKDFATST